MKKLVKLNYKCFSYYFLVMILCFSIFTFKTSVTPSEPPTQASSFWLKAQSKPFDKGSGTESNPYIISTKEHFAFFAQRIESGDSHFQGASYALGNTLNVSEHIWVPINVTSPNFNFFGNYFTIDGLTLNTESYLNLFKNQLRAGGFFQLFNGTLTKTSFNNINISTQGQTSLSINAIANIVTPTATIDYVQVVNLKILSDATSISGVTQVNDEIISNTFVTGSIDGISSEYYATGDFYTTKTTKTTIDGFNASHEGTQSSGPAKFYIRGQSNSTASYILTQYLCGIYYSGSGTLLDSYFAGKLNSYRGKVSFRSTHDLFYNTTWTHDFFMLHTTSSNNGRQYACGGYVWGSPEYNETTYHGDVPLTIVEKSEWDTYNYGTEIKYFGDAPYPLANNPSRIQNSFYYVEPVYIAGGNNVYPTTSNFAKKHVSLERTAYGIKNQYINENYIYADSSNINFGYPRLKGFYWEDMV